MRSRYEDGSGCLDSGIRGCERNGSKRTEGRKREREKQNERKEWKEKESEKEEKRRKRIIENINVWKEGTKERRNEKSKE